MSKTNQITTVSERLSYFQNAACSERVCIFKLIVLSYKISIYKWFFRGYRCGNGGCHMAENQNYENSLIGLTKFYGNYYEDKNTDFGAESWNHIFDPETYEILLVQSKKDGSILEKRGSWKGKKCYEYFEECDGVCKDCEAHKIGHDNFYVQIKENALSGRQFFMEGLRIEQNGRPVILQKVIDITDPVYKDVVMKEYVCIKNLSNKVLSTLMEESHITENFEKVCQEICEFFDADRALITEYHSGKLNTTWSRVKQPFTQVCTVLSPETINDITEGISSLNYIWVPDVPNADKLDKNLRDYWSAHGIRSILLIPMTYNDRFLGTVSLHNIRAHLKAIDTLKLIGMAVAKCIHAYVMEEEAEKQLYTDPLTGMLNMSGMKRRAYELLREYPDNKYYLCVMDIRYFGGINRRYGFELGDKILIETAKVLDQYLNREEEVFCRISEDVFCFLAKYPGKDQVMERFLRFDKKMQRFDELTSAGYEIEYQCGAYIINGDKNIARIIDKANLARLSLKNERGSRIVFFSDELWEQSRYETELLQDFRPALSQGELTVYYQPQCNYALQKIVGAEALVRWKSKKHGNVSPAVFVPLLERQGLIYELDRFVWEEVCKQQQAWIRMGFECPISVNVSRYDVLHHNFREDLEALLERYKIPKKLLPLEITETAYIKNSEELVEIVDMLKKSGFVVEMDDFGSGYSSLNALKDVPVDLLKLDMKFLDVGDQKEKAGSILSCIVKMTEWLGLGVLAEGVETKEQADYLKGIGCDLMQGYYFAKPVPAGNFEHMLTVCMDDISGLNMQGLSNVH